jgi:hypothetical protein
MTTDTLLKVPKCEIFDLFDFNEFYVMKSLQVGDFRDEINKKKLKFVPDLYHIIFASVCAVCAGNDFLTLSWHRKNCFRFL